MATQTFTTPKDFSPYSIKGIATAVACITVVPSALLAVGVVLGGLLAG